MNVVDYAIMKFDASARLRVNDFSSFAHLPPFRLLLLSLIIIQSKGTPFVPPSAADSQRLLFVFSVQEEAQ
jgi:hypothetical protein